jgi:uncharacterized damage-inducible protein DinB
MFTTIEHFREQWQIESDGTRKFLSVLTNESLSQKVADDHRTLGRIVWHIVLTIPEMMERTGIAVDGPTEHDPIPADIETIRKKYNRASESLLYEIIKNWRDATLEEEDDMYGTQWKKGLTLFVLLKHEIHHRAQAMVLARQAGIKVPGLYGPSKEEWVHYGAAPPEI